MKTKVILLGTGCPILTKDRLGPATLVRVGKYSFLFDVGAGAIHRLLQLDLVPDDLTAIFLTHHHSDHFYGLAEMLHMNWIWTENKSHIPIIAPNGPIKMILDDLFVPFKADIAIRRSRGLPGTPTVNYTLFDAALNKKLIWHEGKIKIYSSLVDHGTVIPAVGYRVETSEGNIAISGDTCVTDRMLQLAEDADIIVNEVMSSDLFLHIRGDNAHTRSILSYHSDSIALGKFLGEINTPNVMLTHLAPPPMTRADENRLMSEVRRGGYKGNLIVGADLTSLELPGVRKKAA